MTPLLVLVGCTGFSDDGGKWSEGLPEESGGHDSAPTGESGGGDETGDGERIDYCPMVVGLPDPPPPLPEWTREPIDPDWRGGDPVPGWDDRDCPYRVGPDVLQVAYPWGTEHTIAMGRNVHSPGPPQFVVAWLKWYDVQPEEGGGYFVFPFDLYLSSWAQEDGRPPPGDPRGTGWYGPRGTANRKTDFAVAYTPFDLITEPPDHHGGASSCFRYVGPDRYEGSTYIAPAGPPGHKDGRSPYGIVSWEVDFRNVYQEHSGIEMIYDHTKLDDAVAANGHVGYSDNTTYVLAWPWEEITDPGIRSALFWRYMPANDPYCIESLRRTGLRP